MSEQPNRILPDGLSSELQVEAVKTLQSATVRFAGDSGDGVQLAGLQFTNESAVAGADFATIPNFPSEIRPPSGSLAGVSGFQIQLGSQEVCTPGDLVDVLVVFNPAALRANIDDVRPGGVVILNEDTFVSKNLKKAGYQKNPMRDDKLLNNYRVYNIPITKMTLKAVNDIDLPKQQAARCKNFFALGIALRIFNLRARSTLSWIGSKFKNKPELIQANTIALKAGMGYVEETKVIDLSFIIKPAMVEEGVYRNFNGTCGIVYGLIAASQKSGRKLFYGAYPITPASEILHSLVNLTHFGVTIYQAEDEIAAVGAAIGAAFAGNLAVTATSGPGLSLMVEALGLAVITEFPLVVIDVQRAGPSTGLPTKTEQSDLFLALHGRHGDAPLCVLAASSPATSFTLTYEACRIAMKYMTPVIVLSEGYIVNTVAPWKVVDPDELPEFELPIVTETNNPSGMFHAFKRDKKTLSRPWALPGTPGLIHRIGGLENDRNTGDVSYMPENHHLMTLQRAKKIEGITCEIPETKVVGETTGDLLVLGWGGTQGVIKLAVREAQKEGLKVSAAHLFYLNPLPPDLGEILKGFKKVLIPENNMGQLCSVIRNKYQVDAISLNRITGQLFRAAEIKEAIQTNCIRTEGN